MTFRLKFLVVHASIVAHFIRCSDGWNDRPDVVRGNEENVAGGMSIKLTSPKIADFDEYFNNLNPYTNSRNPWFKEFWAKTYDCTFNDNPVQEKGFKKCTGKETRREREYVQDSKLGFVINAVYTMAHALHNMQVNICGSNKGLCPEMLPVKGDLYLDYLLNVSLTTYSNYELHYDANGDPPARYDIMNFQKIKDEAGNVTYKYVRVGSWETGQLSMNESLIYWPSSGFGSEVESVCSDPCTKGSVKKLDDQTKCCWTCIPCKENEIMMDSNTCKACAIGWWPNEELTACKEINIEYLSWYDNEAVIVVAVSCCGIFATLWIGVIFLRHHDTPVVKASTRELMYIIMLGIIMAYSSNFVLLAKPTIVTCYFSRILPGLSFSLIYGSLVTKTNRIARILEGTKKIITKKPRFMSASAQVIITCIVVGIECAIITVMLIIEPADSMLDYPTVKRVRLICNTTTMGIAVPFGFDLMLIFMCTLYAIKTRNLPENFNEAKFIGFTMYTTCVIWLGFFAYYFGSEPMILTMSICIFLSATVALVLLFFPKVYVIVCAPEKNTRSAFTTSKDVRCHIGSVSYHSESGNDFGKDKMPFEKGIGFPHRKKFSFGKLKLGQKHTINNRKETASLPPNIKLNRENSMHIQVPTNQKFPWNKKDNSNSDSGDENDRLSTISSKEESRSGSEKRRRQCKQDCGCQTDADLYDNLLYRSSIRRRRAGNVCHESNGSINSDEIFLSLPVSDSTDHRGVYRLSPRHSDRSPLLGGYDSSLEGDRKGEDFYFPMNNFSNLLVHENVSAEVPFKSESLHPLNKREPLPIKRTDDSYAAGTSIKYSSESFDSKLKDNNDESEKLIENGHLVQIDEIPFNNSNSCTIHKSPPTLKIGYSDLYKRRQFPHPVIVEEKSLDKSRYPLSKMQQKTCVSPLQQTGHCNCVITDAIPGQFSRPRLSVTSYTSSAASPASADDMATYGIQKLEEEEVSMLSFRDYMKNRGIDLDMSDVQSSEV